MLSANLDLHGLQHRLGAYLLAVVSVGVATFLRWLIDPFLGNEHPLLVYYAAMAVVAWRGGWWPALFTMLLSYLVADWCFMLPRREFSIFSLQPVHLVGLGTFMGTGLVIAAFSEATKRARYRAESNARLARSRGDSLEKEIGERSRAENELRQSQERLGLALDAARMVAWKWDRASNQTVFSSNATDVTGVAEPFRIQNSKPGSLSIHPDDLVQHTNTVASAIVERRNYVSQFRFVRPDNRTVIWLEDHAKVTCDPAGEPESISGIVMDVTRRKQAESQIADWNRELERRVKDRTEELEAFCYSVSHDLRGPLRAILSFAELLIATCAELKEEHKKFVQTIINAAKRIDALINDLLSLSRLSRCKVEKRSFNLSQLATRIVTEIQKTDPQRQTEFVVAPDITVDGDEGLLRIVMENLLNNAWKFTGRRENGRIEIGVEAREGTNVYFIHDNGAGFDMEDAKRIFRVFERLHTEAEFPGTGIGLAIVERIVSRHGGKIWAEGVVNEGATFFFTLPPGNQPEFLRDE
jgi:PAS domain S-box-containing protein